MEFDVKKNLKDKRKESFNVREETIQVVGQETDKARRFSIIERGIVEHREELERRKSLDNTSIGIVEIELVGFDVRRRKALEKPSRKQMNLFVNLLPLDPLKVEMRLKYRCKNNPKCEKGHEGLLLAWELSAALVAFESKYGGEESAVEHLSREIVDRFADPKKKCLALLSTHFKYGTWMIGGLYWFPREISGSLF